MRPIALALAALAAASPSRAAEKPSIDRVVRLYENLELERALEMADRLLRTPKLSPEDRARALVYKGLILANTESEQSMYRAFKDALKADPSVQLPQGQAPQTEAAFVRAKKELGILPDLPPPPPPPTVEAPPPPEPPKLTATARGVAGGQIQVQATVGGSEAVRARTVRVYVREPGEPMYKRYDLRPTGEPGVFETRTPAPEGASVAELYVEGTREGVAAGRWPVGEATARVDLAGAIPPPPPLPSPIEPAAPTDRRVIYAGIGGGAALVLAVVIVVVLASGGGPTCPSSGNQGCLKVEFR